MADEKDLSPELGNGSRESAERPGWPYVRPTESFEVASGATLPLPRAPISQELIDELTTSVD